MCYMFAGSRLLLPVPINCVTLVPETREEGGTRCQRALAAEERERRSRPVRLEAAAALTGSPRERGEGGSRAQSREYPLACEGRWGYVTSGAGPRAVGTERGRWSE